jgi:hypothetical protein
MWLLLNYKILTSQFDNDISLRIGGFAGLPAVAVVSLPLGSNLRPID